MASTHQRYELSIEADKDLEDIFNYSVFKFGLDQAVIYVSSFEETFECLCSDPKLGRERSDIRKELRSLVKGSHVIFYRIMADHLRIVRILHTSRDVKSFIPLQAD